MPLKSAFDPPHAGLMTDGVLRIGFLPSVYFIKLRYSPDAGDLAQVCQRQLDKLFVRRPQLVFLSRPAKEASNYKMLCFSLRKLL